VKRAHKKLEVWQEGVVLATSVYELTEAFPKSEIYGLVSQMRRAVVSIPSNIAEGAARFSTKEFAQFLSIAGGSLSELDTQLEIAFKLGFIESAQKTEIDSKIDSISAKLAGLINKVRVVKRERCTETVNGE
jgi:four helix bundle protein